MKLNKIFNISFFTIITLLLTVTLFLPKRRFSQTEQRELETMPKLTFEALENGEYIEKADKYMKDHFVFRNTILKAKSKLELLSGNHKINGVYVTDEFLAKDFEVQNKEIAEKNIEAINVFFEKHGAYNKTALMLIPTSIEFQKQELILPEAAADQINYIKSLYEKTRGVNCADSYSALKSLEGDKCFYRTDSRLTSYGAYAEYTALSKALSLKAVPWDMFNVEHVSHDFLGDCYSRVLVGEELKDTVDLYHYSGEDKAEVLNVIKYSGGKTRTYSSIFFREYLDEATKCDVFLGKSEPVIKIKTTVENGEKLLVFCDSKTYLMMQFLPLHYEEITLVNLDLLEEPLENYLRLYRYNNILFLYDIESFSNCKSIAKLSEI